MAKIKLPEDQEANARIIKHVSGTGPIYVRALAKMEFNEVNTIILLPQNLSKLRDYCYILGCCYIYCNFYW